MLEKSESANQKLNTFFNKLIKEAVSLGYFSDVSTGEDIQKYAPMIFKMLQLPKYEKIKSELKNSYGVVNFVVRNEWGAFVELLLKSVFSPSDGNIYTMNHVPSSSDYFINASSPAMFDKPTGDPGKLHGANQKLDYLLHGSKKYFNTPEDFIREYSAATGLTEENIIDQLAKHPEDETKPMLFDLIEKRAATVSNIHQVENNLRNMQNENAIRLQQLQEPDGLTEDPDVLRQRNRTNDQNIKKARAYLEQFRTKKEKLEGKIDEIIAPYDALGGESEREQDGFIHYNPISHLVASFSNIIKSTVEFRSVQSIGANLPPTEKAAKIANLMTTEEVAEVNKLSSNKIKLTDKNGVLNLSPALLNDCLQILRQIKQNKLLTLAKQFSIQVGDYASTNKNIISAQIKLMNFLQVPLRQSSNPEDKSLADQKLLTNLISNTNTFNGLCKSLFEDGVQQGNTVIFTNFQESGLCIPVQDEKEKGKYKVFSPSVFQKFVSTLESKDRKVGVDSMLDKLGLDPKKRILLISDSPLANLPESSRIIELKNYAVDEKEADIIVNSILDSLALDARNQWQTELYKKIEEKYLDVEEMTDELKNEKKEETTKTTQLFKRVRSKLGRLSPTVIQEMKKLIIGSGQKQAIDILTNTIEKFKVKKGPIIYVKQRELIPELRKESVERKKSKAFEGIMKHIDKPLVAIESYVALKSKTPRRRESKEGAREWADQVKDISSIAKDIRTREQYLKNQYANYYKLTNEFEFIKKESDAKAIANHQLLISNTINEIKTTETELQQFVHSIPHVFLLYGHKGTGKTIWGHCLADLLNLSLEEFKCEALRQKFHGEGERVANEAIDVVKGSQNTVFIFDEIEKALASSAEKTDVSAAMKATVGVLMKFFGGPLDFLKENNSFLVLAANTLDALGDLKTRLGTCMFEVPEPTSAEEFMSFFSGLKQYLRRKHGPNHPPIKNDITSSNEQGWKDTDALLDSIDFQKISKAIENEVITKGDTREYDFRLIDLAIDTWLSMHQRYIESLRQIREGNSSVPSSIPFTTANFLNSVPNLYCTTIEVTGKPDNVQYGTKEVMKNRIDQVNKNFEELKNSGKLKMKKVFNKYINKEVEVIDTDDPTYQENILKITQGTMPEMIQDIPEPKVKENIDPQTGEKTLTLTDDEIVDEMEKLEEGGMQQVKEEEPKPDEKKDKNKDKVKSSTDYYYNYLKKSGALNSINPKQEQKPKLNTPNTPNTQNKPVLPKDQQAYQSEIEQGVYYLDNGVYVGPANSDVDPVNIFNIK